MNKRHLFIAANNSLSKSWNNNWERTIIRFLEPGYSFHSLKTIRGLRFGIMFITSTITNSQYLESVEWTFKEKP
jgi:hypothetical protein